MTTSARRARHRLAQRPITPLTTLTQAASGTAVTIGRRTAVVAASSGLLVSIVGAAPASAEPASNQSLSSFDVGSLTAEARTALATAPVVTVATDAEWSLELAPITVTPAPEPEPEPEPVVEERTTTSTSRTTERDAIPAETVSAETAAVPVVEAPAAAAPAAAAGSTIIDIASRYVGVPYVYGGTTPDGFDCSGFTSYVYAQAGITLPRTSGEQQGAGTVVSRDQAQPGDLIFSPGHIGIYAGGNTMIDAPRPGKTIQFRDMWMSNPTFIRIG